MHVSHDLFILCDLSFLILGNQNPSGEMQGITGGQQRKQLLPLALIVQHRDLGRLWRAKLLPLRIVSERYCDGTLQLAQAIDWEGCALLQNSSFPTDVVCMAFAADQQEQAGNSLSDI